MTPSDNAAMAEAWEAESEHWVAHEERYDRSAAAHESAMLELAGISASDVILDVGCGTGGSTRAAASLAPSGVATGVDLAERMVEHARRIAEREGIENVRFEVADAQVHAFPPRGVDVVISRFGAMFFGDPVAAFTNLRSATRPDGRLALVAWQSLDRNDWQVQIRGAIALGRDLPVPPVGVPGPFALAEPDRARTLLEDAGWRDVVIDEVEVPMWLGPDADDAFEFVRGTGFVKGALGDLDDRQQAEALERLRVVLADATTDVGVELPSRSWAIAARNA
jgi:SAM-dependent methyltransferase